MWTSKCPHGRTKSCVLCDQEDRIRNLEDVQRRAQDAPRIAARNAEDAANRGRKAQVAAAKKKQSDARDARELNRRADACVATGAELRQVWIDDEAAVARKQNPGLRTDEQNLRVARARKVRLVLTVALVASVAFLAAALAGGDDGSLTPILLPVALVVGIPVALAWWGRRPCPRCGGALAGTAGVPGRFCRDCGYHGRYMTPKLGLGAPCSACGTKEHRRSGFRA